MAWYRIGTIAVTNGSAVVTGTGTGFVANVQIGHAINLPDGKAYEVAAINSDTQITLGSNYLGATASGQAYSIQPNQGFAQQAAAALAAFLTQYSGYLSTALSGRFADGTAASPGVTFASDQDTGIRRAAENVMSLVTGGADRMTVDGAGNVGVGTTTPSRKLSVATSAAGMTFNLGLHNDAATADDSHGVAVIAHNSTNTTRNYLGLCGSSVRVLTTDIERMRIDPSGNVGIGVTAPLGKFHVNTASGDIVFGPNGADSRYRVITLNGALTDAGYAGLNFSSNAGDANLYLQAPAGGAVVFRNNGGVERGRFDPNGNLLVGIATAQTTHTIVKGTVEGDWLLNLSGTNQRCLRGFSAASAGYSTTNAALWIAANSGTGRSANLAGTLNASGADYAEYMRKADGAGAIAKGDVCGVDVDGKLVTAWSAVRSFVVKSTNPNLVGGDTWSAHLGDPPEEPMYVPPRYDGPVTPVEPIRPTEPAAIEPAPTEPVRGDGEDDDAFAIRRALYLLGSAAWIQTASDYHVAVIAFGDASAAYEAALVTYRSDLADYQTATAAHDAALTKAEADHDADHARYVTDLAAFEAELEAARASVDRIAFCGQVPVNVAGEFAVGDYIVAAQYGDAIKAVAVAADAITFDQYRLRIGKVWAVRDGRAWIDVQHG